ncbi:hypothetical protein SS50377_25721 [Spironucleus salmonicida]|uniref:Uncharacterized protein n=1 Tax=Spironucleus salmonicida TaxID=348837 RepID=V6LPL7_9EUKA|nr:hypothetical protein SS50377_25721 [Spironucleus salmonicida]|eukprot:EST42669.1 Hypothetical protein SS50377_17684 [Spironucleus salmonicida]
MDKIINSLPLVPQALIDANFDHIQYLNTVLQPNKVNQSLINNLILETEVQMQQITEQMEDIVLKPQIQFNLGENSHFISDIHIITSEISNVENVISQFANNTQQLNLAKQELDNIQFIVECCNQFLDIQESSNQQILYKFLLYQKLQNFSDIPELFEKLKDFEVKIDNMSIQKIDQVDIFEFWAEAFSRAMEQFSIGKECKFYDSLIKQLLQANFIELFNANKLDKQFSQKVLLFFKLHKQYMDQMAPKISLELLPSRVEFLLFMNKFAQNVSNLFYYTEKEFILKYDFFILFIQSFMKILSQKISKDIQNQDIFEVIVILQQCQEIEAYLLQENVIQNGDLMGEFHSKHQQILEYIQSQVLESLKQKFSLPVLNLDFSKFSKQQLSAYYDQDFYIIQKENLNHVFALLQLLPSQKSINKNFISTISSIFQQVNNFVIGHLDFRHIIPIQIHRFVKRTDYAQFKDLVDGKVSSIVKFKCLNSGSLILVDYSMQENIIKFMVQLLKLSKFSVIFVQKCSELLKGKNFEGLVQGLGSEDLIELCLLSLISGQFVSSVFIDKNIKSARQVMQTQFTFILDKLRQFYDEFAIDSFFQLSSTVLIENTAAGCLLLLQDSQQIEQFSDEIRQFFDQNNFLENGADISIINKIISIMKIRQRVLDNATITRDEFISILGQESVSWYNEICG